SITGNRVTVSTVLIAGHAGPETMQWIAERGRGRFYDVRSPDRLPQIFIKETAVILKSAISEQPFVPQRVSSSELIRGLGDSFPVLRGHVATTGKGRAEIPLLTESGDPLLAHWQYGLGRSVAFTSDARARWASQWLPWDQYRQFWSQIAQWALRRVENTDFASEVTVDKGRGVISVEAVDDDGNFQNFLELNARVVDPSGEGQDLRLEQTAPGRYEARFDAESVGAYTINLMQMEGEKLVGTQMIGTSLNFSPEFSSSETKWNLLNRLAEISQGKVFTDLSMAADPFHHDRIETFQPKDLWEWLLRFSILLFPFDVALRRIQIDREEWLRAYRWVVARVFFWTRTEPVVTRDESLGALLSRRDAVRSSQDREPAVIQPVSSARSRAEKDRPIAPPKKPSSQTELKEDPSSSDVKIDEGSTASRLLAAKRRARRKR
ncbi:glutamine amidotransferase, partial [bacterium]|nr:glutamine amidotransferase [bacterium]